MACEESQAIFFMKVKATDSALKLIEELKAQHGDDGTAQNGLDDDFGAGRFLGNDGGGGISFDVHGEIPFLFAVLIGNVCSSLFTMLIVRN